MDAELLQLCSSQLKLLQLYTDIQQLYSATDVEETAENVRIHTHTHRFKEIKSFFKGGELKPRCYSSISFFHPCRTPLKA